MKKYKYILGCALAAVALSSCNNYDFEQNFYPHKVGLMAGSNRIYDRRAFCRGERYGFCTVGSKSEWFAVG